jgi:hypothetical protein
MSKSHGLVLVDLLQEYRSFLFDNSRLRLVS